MPDDIVRNTVGSGPDPIRTSPSTTSNEPTSPPVKADETATPRKRSTKKAGAKPRTTAKRARKGDKVGGIHPFGTCVPQGECVCQS